MLHVLSLVLLVLPMTTLAQEAGEVTVQVLYRGVVPPAQSVPVTRDAEFCGATAVTQTVTVHPHSRGLKDAVVIVEGVSLPSNTPTSPAPAVLSNSRCTFAPSVMVLQGWSSIEIGNQDPIMHNTHIRHGESRRTVLNVALVPGGRPISKKIAAAGLYHVQCDAHPFMRGYVIVRDHPFMAVSDEQGLAKIVGVPPGTHEISVWHERLGELRSKVTVPPSGTVRITIDFPAEALASHSSLDR
ncbi:MAG: hypothetical protein NNA24_11265 [Nitrospira sp.]|nr:hypothetical protein [Nitrospira sp.]